MDAASQRVLNNMLLMFAINSRNHAEVERLLDGGADPNYVDPNVRNGGNRTPLQVAFAVQDPVSVQLLVARGARGIADEQEEGREIRLSECSYKRRSGTFAIAGQLYESKLLALVLLRLRKAGYECLLGTNVDEVGEFDDLCVRYRRVGEVRFKYCFIQAKHQDDREKKKITFELLHEVNQSKNNHYSVFKHFDSYLKVRERFGRRDDFFVDKFVDADVELALYTTAKSAISTGNHSGTSWLVTNNGVQTLKIESHEELIGTLSTKVDAKLLEKIRKHENQLDGEAFRRDLAIDFLQKFSIYHNQASESEVGTIIASELVSMADNRHLLAIIYHDLVQQYWMRKNDVEFLTECSNFLEQAEQITADRHLLSHLTSIFYAASQRHELEYVEEATSWMDLERLAVGLNVYNAAASVLSYAKLSRYAKLKYGESLAIVELDLVEWECDRIFAEFVELNKFTVMIVFCSRRSSHQLGKLLLDLAARSGQKKKVIVVSDEPVGGIPGLERIEDDRVGLGDLTEECRGRFLKEKSLQFQGKELKFAELMVPSETITAEVVLRVVRGELLEIGQFYAKSVAYYVRRKFSRSGEQLSIDSVESFRKDRIVIVAAEPGMGKSTLMTELSWHGSEQWIVRFNLLDYTTRFEEIVREEINVRVAIGFLLHVVGLDGVSVEFQDGSVSLEFEGPRDELKQLELKVFEGCYNRGGLVVLADGFDEIAPRYLEYVLALLSAFKASRLWRMVVTTRDTNVSRQLEDHLKVPVYGLVPFKEQDVRAFFRRFWATSLNIQQLDVAKVEKVTEELLKQYPLDTDSFLSVPLHNEMIARCVQKEFAEYHATGSPECIERLGRKLNELSLYEEFIRIKFDDIYLKEKNKINPSLPFRIDSGLDESFRKVHMRLALEVAFYPHHVELIAPEEVSQIPKDLEAVKACREKCGFISRVVNDKPQFTHVTFAEFFVAKYIWERFRLSEIESFMEITTRILIGNLVAADRVQICKFLLGFAQDSQAILDCLAKGRILLDALFIVDCGGNQSSSFLLGLVERCLTGDDHRMLCNIEFLHETAQLSFVNKCAEMGYCKLLLVVSSMWWINLPKQLHYEWSESPLLKATKNDRWQAVKILVDDLAYSVNDPDGLNCRTLFLQLLLDKDYARIAALIKSGVTELLYPIDQFSKSTSNSHPALTLPIECALQKKAPPDLIKTILEATDLIHFELASSQNISLHLLSYDPSLTEAFLRKGVNLVPLDEVGYRQWYAWLDQLRLTASSHGILLRHVQQVRKVGCILRILTEPDGRDAMICLKTVISMVNDVQLVVEKGQKRLEINGKRICVSIPEFAESVEDICHSMEFENLTVSSVYLYDLIAKLLDCDGIGDLFNTIQDSDANNFFKTDVLNELVEKSSQLIADFNHIQARYLKLIAAIETQDPDKVSNELLDQNKLKTILNSRDDQFGSPLLYATSLNNPAIPKILLDHGAKPNARATSLKPSDKSGFTELHRAAADNDLKRARRCIVMNHDMKARASNGFTPLHVAAERGHVAVTKLLLRSMANCGLSEDDRGQSARELALAKGFRKVAQIIETFDWEK